MARNRVQFQKGLSEADFDKSYGTEEQCHAALVAWRWPGGFECPDCCGRNHCVVTRQARRLFQCNACRKQTSVKAGTVITHPYRPLMARQAGADGQARVARSTSKGFAALRRAVSIVVRTSASACAAHMA